MQKYRIIVNYLCPFFRCISKIDFADFIEKAITKGSNSLNLMKIAKLGSFTHKQPMKILNHLSPEIQCILLVKPIYLLIFIVKAKINKYLASLMSL